MSHFNYTYYVTSKTTGYTLVFSYHFFNKWYENVWNKNKILDYYWIIGKENENI